jgi:hypothetical protein
MSISKGVRQFHRWVSIAFTLTVLANFAAMTQGPPPAWITYSPLLPLFLLLLTGLYMFALPYAARRRATESGSQAS